MCRFMQPNYARTPPIAKDPKDKTRAPFEKEPSPEIPMGSPLAGQSTRNSTNTSPTHLIGNADTSRDAPVRGGAGFQPTFDGQDAPDLEVSPEALAACVTQGGLDLANQAASVEAANTSTGSLDSWIDDENLQISDKDKDLTEAQILKTLQEDVAETRKAIDLKKEC